MARVPVTQLIQLLSWCVLAAAADLDFRGLAARAGYTASKHRVTTADGYLLSLYRLGRGGGRPVLLMHGFLASGDLWLAAGAAGLPALLAADCDLWVGNFRGTYEGRAHTTLDPDSDAFWDFSLHELGYYDIPALIDYVLQYTGHAQLGYVGHSQGGGTFLIMASERPEYNAKVEVYVGLAAATRLYRTSSAAVRLSRFMIAVLRSLRQKEIFDRRSLVFRVFNQLCAVADKFSFVYSTCESVLAFIDTFHQDAITKETMVRLYRHFPAGVSLKTLSHFEQLSRSKTFNKYDYGIERNMAAYGRPIAPRYNLTRVTAPTVLIYGMNDRLITPKNTIWLKNQLPNVVNFSAVADPRWNHLDFIFSKDIPTQLYPLVRDNFKMFMR